MTKADIPVMPQFFDRYINLVDDMDLVTALTQADTFDKLMPSGTMEAIADMQYAPGKWTGKDILQHLIDTERIMAYRHCVLPATTRLTYLDSTRTCLANLPTPATGPLPICTTNMRWSGSRASGCFGTSTRQCYSGVVQPPAERSPSWRLASC